MTFGNTNSLPSVVVSNPPSCAKEAACKACGITEGLIPGVGYCKVCLDQIMVSHASQSVHPEQSLSASQSRHSPNDHTKPDESLWYLQGSCNTEEKDSQAPIRKVFVANELAEVVKDHQKEGVEFIWKNCFSDCNSYDDNQDPEHHQKPSSEIGGCILAHYMGLGKSLTTITLLHTVLNCPTLKKANHKPLFRTVLMVVPANTLTNWEDEVQLWTDKLDEPLIIHNLAKINKDYRGKEIDKWKRQGGLLIMSEVTLLKECDNILQRVQPDILVLDEAHTMLKRSSNQTFKKLQQVQTKRKILLTGTPFQNNVSEYFQMVEFIRPGIMGVASVAAFEEMYRVPIERGLPCDARPEFKLEALEKQLELKLKLDPYLHRKSPKILHDGLPPLHDTLLYLQPSVIQQKLMKSHKRQQKNGVISNNFLRTYANLAPLLNHPACLKIQKGGRGLNISWKSSCDSWLQGLKPEEYEQLDKAKNSPKLILLAHILAMAEQSGEKVLVYTQCLKTMDSTEHFLASDWKKSVISLKDSFKDVKLGGWKKNKDYVRIDGGVNSGKRGTLVDKFNSKTEGIKAFLISSLAGGIGINLCGATLVVMMDSHFNPSISSQCISRAHRYGQTKPVRVYRLAIENSMESRVYARSQNKSGVAMQVIDGIFSEGVFSNDELADLTRNDIVVKCDRCGKHRLLPESQDPPEESTEWFCNMNEDTAYNSCHIAEGKTVRRVQRQGTMQSSHQNDPILQHLRGVINMTTRRDPLVSSAYPVKVAPEADICCEEAITKLRDDIHKSKADRAALVLAAQQKCASRNGDALNGRDATSEKLAKRNIPQQATVDEDDDEVQILEVRPAKFAKNA